MIASLAGQNQTINVLSTENHDCVGLTFTPIRSARHLYTMKLNTADRCAGCRIEERTARVVFDVDYCQYKVRFVGMKGVESIRIRESDHTVLLKGPDESRLRRFFATMCNLGGVPLSIDKVIKLEKEVDGMSIELQGGTPSAIEAPAPMNAWVTARDSCGHNAFAIIPIDPM